MSKKAPTQEEQDQFWTILNASTPAWKAIELERIAMYYLNAPATGSDDAAIVAKAAFSVFSNATAQQRYELMAGVSTAPAFKDAKKALGIRPPPKALAKSSNPRRSKPDPEQAELTDFWTRLENSAAQWTTPQALNNLLAYYLQQPLSKATEAQLIIEDQKPHFFNAPADAQRETMASLSATPEMKSAAKADLAALKAKPAGPKP